MKITETSGNGKNGIRGQRISVYAEVGEKMYLIDRFVVTSKFGAIRYCNNHPSGQYGQRYIDATTEARHVEATKMRHENISYPEVNTKTYRAIA